MFVPWRVAAIVAGGEAGHVSAGPDGTVVSLGRVGLLQAAASRHHTRTKQIALI
jgi:hypothetical protein